MRAIKRRIAFHFSIQIIFIIAFVITVFLVALFLIIDLIMNEEIDQDYPEGALSAIATEASIDNGQVDLPSSWNEELKDKRMWLQIINEQGEAIHSINQPDDLPNRYRFKEVLELSEEESWHGYDVATYHESLFFDGPYLFVMGYHFLEKNLLTEWINLYNEDGTIPNRKPLALDESLQELDGYLHIVNKDGEVLQTFGDAPSNKNQYEPIELVTREVEHQNYDTHATFEETSQDTIWILHTKKQQENTEIPTIKRILFTLILIGSVVLLTLILLSVWQGIRYGQPLLLFISWLERMRHGEYEEVFTPKERKKLFTKKHKIRFRFRLYKEVIQGVYEMAAQLNRTEKERSLLDQKREEWMSGISHDLRTPLSTIQGYGHMLESAQYDWTKEELQEMGHTIREKGDYMLDLIQDFSLISQLKQKDVPVHFETLNLSELISSHVRREQQPVEYQVNEQPVLIEGNSKWIQRLLDNLIHNAIKHNPAPINVTVSVHASDHNAILRVRDNGKGMDEQTQKNLFTRYYRGTNTEDHVDGSGLGMSISKAIVQAHNGEIDVESHQGKGTVIDVTFPLSSIE
ncbi:HAMP domain-containing histidine kinase [Halobacillus litoralis]|uniref:sensor histidine kinase n=1 Tax=Halobacillus litoralis TaxID=45668 RepID=UPI001CD24C8F|nr:HAMP domain-containing sensor histidine kinase [Halobacillus litoralis]MCA0970685.1 HAMP domain-containing histidine kinase [Halobacillus litoralis]